MLQGFCNRFCASETKRLTALDIIDLLTVGYMVRVSG